ncbi:hypothetical protein [uncultured Methanomethylovorans sp.]|uniref:hypothetical protein n=1 Tax=uncultured Methanomethylovorans sp. TaxID=183759 RepID=UPI002621D6CE|nr:hypothetical protein [uncultured Methanomethylovorans sp.]
MDDELRESTDRLKKKNENETGASSLTPEDHRILEEFIKENRTLLKRLSEL